MSTAKIIGMAIKPNFEYFFATKLYLLVFVAQRFTDTFVRHTAWMSAFFSVSHYLVNKLNS